MYKTITIILFLIAVISCNDKDTLEYTIGDDFLQSETSVAIVDTFDIDLSTFMVDSMVTSNTLVGLVGNYRDPELGLVKAQSYFQIGIADKVYVADENDKLDSLIIKMKYSGDFYGDTTKIQKINVYRLTQEMLVRNDKNLYNNSSFAHETEPIGSITLRPEPLKDNSIEIRLSDSWGLELLNMIKDNYSSIRSTANFIKYLPGLMIESETSDGSILSFSLADTTCNMTLYTHRFDFKRVETKFIFPFTNPELQFNHIESDRSGTNSTLITDNRRNDIPSSLTANRSFVQGGTGIFTRVEFPQLARVLEMSQRRILLKAELILKPMRKSYQDYHLPKSLYVYESNRNNEILGPLTYTEGSEKKPITAKLVLDDLYYKDTYYKFDVTSFISTELGDGYFDVNHALLINIPTGNIVSTTERIIFPDQSDAKYKPILKLYYVFYN